MYMYMYIYMCVYIYAYMCIYIAFGGFTAAVRLLVDSGADPDKRDKDGWTALRLAFRDASSL